MSPKRHSNFINNREMAVFVRLGIVLAASFGLLAVASASPPISSLDGIAAAAHAAQATGCTTDDCAAAITVNRAMNILLDGQATAQGLTTPSPSDRDDVTIKRLRQVLLLHPQKFAAVCRRLTDLASAYPPGDLFVAVGAIEIALRMDEVTGNCLPGVLAAFAPTAQASTAIRNAQILCANAWAIGPKDCGRIKQTLAK